MASTNRSVMLVDGNSLTYRAFHALPQDLGTASGQITNAVFGFTSMLINLVRDHRPDGIVVCFDRPEPTFRHQQVETYKANRSAAPDILRQQMGLVRQVVETINIPIVDQAGIEADDLIATLAEEAATNGIDALIVTGDRDSYQLVRDPHIKVLYNRRGVSDYALYDEAGIVERTGVHPTAYVQYAALRGDNSDNLPGVPGVGEKTAAKLITKYGGIEGIYEHLDDQTPKLRENLGANEDQVRINLMVMELVRDVEIGRSLDELMHREPWDPDELKRLFDFLEFRTLEARFHEAFSGDGAPEPAGEALEVTIDPATGAADVAAALDGLADADIVGIAATFDDDRETRLGALAVAGSAERAVSVTPDELADPIVISALDRLLSGDGPVVVGHRTKPVLRALFAAGVADVVVGLDTAVAAYLLDPSSSSYPIEDTLARHTDLRLGGEDDATPEGQLDFGDSAVPAGLVAAQRAAATVAMAAPVRAALDEAELTSLNTDVELPLISVLARMEALGVGVDREELQRLNDELSVEADGLRQAIQDAAGEPFNVNSTKALREILYEKLQLTPGKKTKSGYTTDQAQLEKIRHEHEIVEHLLRYREVEKLRSTYGESLLAEVADDGRIHATFNQTVARTGRLSSEHPNLHNIPVRTEMGRAFRKAFVPSAGHELLVADYNQIELRCIAHLAEDPGLVEAFTSGTDVHRVVAGRVFDVAPDDVDFEQRSKAKMVSYGLAYGMEAYGLGQRLGIPTREAAEILDAYFAGFPAVRDYMDRTVTEARNRGYTETLFGRRRPIPELMSDNPRLRQAGERQAMNAGIQGLAADIFKLALVRLDRRLAADGAASRVILQVHDEVILEVPPSERDVMVGVVLEEMSGAFDLNVPLEVNHAYGATWADAKD